MIIKKNKPQKNVSVVYKNYHILNLNSPNLPIFPSNFSIFLILIVIAVPLFIFLKYIYAFQDLFALPKIKIQIFHPQNILSTFPKYEVITHSDSNLESFYQCCSLNEKFINNITMIDYFCFIWFQSIYESFI